MLKNWILSPSPWHICACCYLRSTHRLHPMLAALGVLFVHQWRARPQQYQTHPGAGRSQEKPLGNVIPLYKWCKEGEKICPMIQTNVKLLICKYCIDKWHNSVRNRQEAISISVSVPGMWSADAKCPSRRVVCSKWKGSGSTDKISYKPSALTATCYYQNKN